VTDALWKSLIPVLAHLSNTRSVDAGAQSLYTIVCDYRFIATLLLTRDILPILTKLSLVLQQKSPPFSLLMTAVPAAIDRIEAQIDHPGTQFEKLPEAIAYLKLHGHAVRHCGEVHQKVYEVTRKDYLRSLVAHLRERLKEVPVLGAIYRLLTPKEYKGLSETDLAKIKPATNKDFGVVADHFCRPPTEGARPRLDRRLLELEFMLIVPRIWAPPCSRSSPSPNTPNTPNTHTTHAKKKKPGVIYSHLFRSEPLFRYKSP